MAKSKGMQKMEFRDLKKQYEILSDDLQEAITKVCASSNYISGIQVHDLEKQLAEYVGVKHCITCGNGTDALTLALMTWNVGTEDAVFVPDFTFFASAECPAREGAKPVFVDVNPVTYNIDPLKLEQAIQETKKEGKYVPKAVIAVDLFGQPAEYESIRKICKRHNLLLLEDGAQGFGGSINGKMACSFGDISITSFFPAKPLGCYGDGGAVFTDNDEWAETIRSLAVHGKCCENKYNNIRIGMNSRLDTLQAAILQVKFRVFKEYELDNVNQVALWYDERLQNIGVHTPVVLPGYYSSWAQYTIQLPDTVERKKVQTLCEERGIPTMVYYEKPLHTQGAFSGTDCALAVCPVAEKICKKVLSLPMHPYMNEEQVENIVNFLRYILEKV